MCNGRTEKEEEKKNKKRPSEERTEGFSECHISEKKVTRKAGPLRLTFRCVTIAILVPIVLQILRNQSSNTRRLSVLRKQTYETLFV